MIDVNKAISSVVKTGKISFGAESAVKNAKSGRAKMIVLTSNCPADLRGRIETYSKLSKVTVVSFRGSSHDLAAVCGKPFAISALSIREAGDSEILKLVTGEEKGEETEEFGGGNE